VQALRCICILPQYPICCCRHHLLLLLWVKTESKEVIHLSIKQGISPLLLLLTAAAAACPPRLPAAVDLAAVPVAARG
jgi:hypothetical protein